LLAYVCVNTAVAQSVKRLYSDVQIIDVHDVSSIYRVPIILDDQQMDLLLAKRLDLSLPAVRPPRFLLKWKDLADRFAVLLQSFSGIICGC